MRAALLAALLLSACRSAIGLPVLPAAPPGSLLTVGVCALLDPGVEPEEAKALLEDWNGVEGWRYAIRFVLAAATPVERSPWNVYGLMAIARSTPLDPPCDRIVYFAAAGPLEYAWGVAAVSGFPIIFGEVDDETGTRGWVQTRWISPPLQLLAWLPPQVIARHEIFHLLGCPHAFTRMECDSRVEALRRSATPDFFPAMSPLAGARPILQTRTEVESALAPAPQSRPASCGGVFGLLACR